MIEVTFLKVLMLIRQVNQKSATFFTYWRFICKRFRFDLDLYNLQLLKQKYHSKPFISYLNINSLSNKIDKIIIIIITVLKNLAILIEKYLCCSLFLINLQAYQPATLLQRDPNTGVSMQILRNFKKPLF